MTFGLVVSGLVCVLAQAGPDLVVSAMPPVDAQRLSDALRTYFADSGVRVATAPAIEGETAGDLRGEIDQARKLGETTRAVAVVRAAHGPQGTIEIELVDLATEKVLLATIPRPPRDEDLYRALALKIQAVLRATLSEAPERLAPESGLGRIVATAPPPPPPAPVPSRFAVQTGYAMLAFPLEGPALQGLGLAAGFTPNGWLELTLATAALGTARREAAGVAVVTRAIPLFAAIRARMAVSRLDLLAGPSLGAVLVDLTASSDATPVQSPRDLLLALGAEAEARFKLAEGAWLFARAAARAVLEGERYRVNGMTVLDTSRLQVDAAAGVAVRLW